MGAREIYHIHYIRAIEFLRSDVPAWEVAAQQCNKQLPQYRFASCVLPKTPLQQYVPRLGLWPSASSLFLELCPRRDAHEKTSAHSSST